MKNILITAAALCVFVSAEEAIAKGEVTGCDTALRIVDVFNTSERLWLYWQNFTIDNTLSNEEQKNYILPPDFNLSESCTFIKKINISNHDFHFWWRTLVQGDMLQSHYYGEFFSESGNEALGSMNVTDLSKQPTESLDEASSSQATEAKPFETMQLMFTEGPCSVFFVKSLTEDSETGCQLYVRGAAVSKHLPKNCTEYYNKHCVTQTVIHKATCKSEVKEAQRELKKILQNF